MLFCTLTYLIFLPLVFIAYWFAKTKGAQNYILLFASMVFYGWWSWRFLLLMVGTCCVNYLFVRQMRKRPEHRKGFLWSCILLDFGILGVFKYMNFFIQNFQTLLSSLGFQPDIHTLQIILPVGISFYTFQLVGYDVDVYRSLSPQRQSDTSVSAPALRDSSLLEFLTFICFFPQLVAGPIERAVHLLPQFQDRRHFSFEDAREGMRTILWGLAKKMLVADNCAIMVNRAFDSAPEASTRDLWFAALFFTFQIYGDFSGYSDIAIGSARLFGIRLSRNFALPYFSTSLQEFWRRWHMTLMSWFRDYVYIPLGGNRCSRLRNWFNTIIVFSLSGFWHGANWTFICWGLYHGILLRIIPSAKSSSQSRHIGAKVCRALPTFFLVLIGWVIFRCPDISYALQYISRMFTPSEVSCSLISRIPLLYILALLLVEFLMGEERLHPFCWKESGILSHQWVRLPVYAILFLFILIAGGEKTPFIYFQF